jgi:hypothetical protein
MMGDDRKVLATEGRLPLEKGYVPSKVGVQDGFKPTTGHLGTPPKGGSAVNPPTSEKKP